MHPESPNYSGPWYDENPMDGNFEMSQDTTATEAVFYGNLSLEPAPLLTQDLNIPRKKKLTSTQMYNNITSKAQLIADVDSSDGHQSYNKVMCLLIFLRSNLQNHTEAQIQSAATLYLGIGEITDMDDIEPSSKRRTQGSVSNQHKKISIEVHNFAKEKTCGFCFKKGQNKQTCPTALVIGKRLTAGLWSMLDNPCCPCMEIDVDLINLEVPINTIAVQVEQFGTLPDATQILYCTTFGTGLNEKKGEQILVKREIMDQWTCLGKSNHHYLFLHYKN